MKKILFLISFTVFLHGAVFKLTGFYVVKINDEVLHIFAIAFLVVILISLLSMILFKWLESLSLVFGNFSDVLLMAFTYFGLQVGIPSLLLFGTQTVSYLLSFYSKPTSVPITEIFSLCFSSYVISYVVCISILSWYDKKFLS